MKTIKLKLFLIMGLLGIFTVFTNCEQDDESIIQENTELLDKSVSAKGDQKSFVDGDINFMSDGIETNFVFHASINDKHEVKGEWIERDSNLNTLSMGSIDCLMFYSTTIAFARGTVLDWNKESPRATNVYFKLVDGEIDEFSGYVFVDDSNCESVFLSTSEIISGDVKVKIKDYIEITPEEPEGDSRWYTIEGSVYSDLEGIKVESSFYAAMNTGGLVIGTWIEKWDEVVVARGDINYLQLYIGKKVFACGTVIDWRREGTPPTKVFFKFADNGDFGIPTKDEFSGYIFSEEEGCSPEFILTTEIDEGDIIVERKGGPYPVDEPTFYTAIPDFNFEQALIDLGWDDGEPDGQVKTEAIYSREELILPGDLDTQGEIVDLTGIEDFASLKTLIVNYNKLTSFNVSKNLNLTTLRALKNPDLVCVRVNPDQKANLDGGILGWRITRGAIYSLYPCKEYTHIPDGYFRHVLFEKYGVTRYGEYVLTKDIEVIEVLRLYDCGVTSLVGLEDFSMLFSLDVRENFNLEIIDIHSNTQLTELYIEGTYITSIDVSQNPYLMTFEYDHHLMQCIQVSERRLNSIPWGWNEKYREECFKIYSLDPCN